MKKLKCEYCGKGIKWYERFYLSKFWMKAHINDKWRELHKKCLCLFLLKGLVGIEKLREEKW